MTKKVKDTIRYTFLVTSAINSKFGIFDPEKRLTDTLKTVESIKKQAPLCPIIILEMCGDPLKDDQKEKILKEVTGMVEFGHDPEVQEIYKINSQDIVKNLTEMLCCHKFFDYANTNQIFRDQRRVFKVSGRYELTDNFNLSRYNEKNLDNSFCFSTKRSSQFTPEITGIDANKNFQYMSRLWSFPANKIAFVANAYRNMGMHMVNRLNQRGYIDIEHLLYQHFFCNIEEKTITEFEIVGIKGAIAPNGMIVED